MENKLTDLAVHSIRYSRFENLPKFKITRDYLTEYFVLMLFDGQIRYSIERGGEYELNSGELLIVPAYYNLDKTALTPLDVGFLNVDVGSGLTKAPLGFPRMKITGRMMEDAELLKSVGLDSEYRRVIMLDIWYQIGFAYSVPKIPEKKECGIPFRPLLEYIESSFREKLTLDELCRVSGYSKSSLIREFKIYTGQTPMDYIVYLRINSVKRLLSDRRLTLREIAVRCGFSNEYYLSTVFKAKTGMTPSEFRRKIQ